MTDHDTLVDGARRGDGAALEELLERHLPALLAYVRLHADPVIKRHESCADVAQSVCREVLGEADRFTDRGEPAFRKWLFQKAMAKLVDHKRYLTRDKRDPERERPLAAHSSWSRIEALYSAAASPSTAATARETLARFEAAFAELEPDQQRAITSSRLLGMSHAEIAREMNRSEGATRALLHRALGRLGLLMDALDDG